MPDTRERWRFRLPHWEVADRPHFVTIRCAGSLPAEAVTRIREIHAAIAAIPASSPEFAALQRQYFLLCERHLDAGRGFCPFREAAVCHLAIESLAALEARAGWSAPHFSAMPNHVHLLLIPTAAAQSLKSVLRGWKWHVARHANRLLQRAGPFWQTDWFAHWSRNDTETRRLIDYIRNNPVKAGLVRRWEDHPWTR
jgi:REP element-mobilizing transposase RayT